MKTKEEIAIATFRSGYNCAQAVLSGFTESLSFETEQAFRISCGFGGGMGKMQETCGAVTGAFMVIGLHFSRQFSDNKDRKEYSYNMIQDFNRKFVALRGSTNCRKILGCDMNTEEGLAFARENNLFDTVCEDCVSDAVKILEDMI